MDEIKKFKLMIDEFTNKYKNNQFIGSIWSHVQARTLAKSWIWNSDSHLRIYKLAKSNANAMTMCQTSNLIPICEQAIKWLQLQHQMYINWNTKMKCDCYKILEYLFNILNQSFININKYPDAIIFHSIVIKTCKIIVDNNYPFDL